MRLSADGRLQNTAAASFLPGDEHLGRQAADIVFTIDEKPHALFKREGNDLVYTHRLPLVDALAGTTLSLTHLDGEQIRIPINEVGTARQRKSW